MKKTVDAMKLILVCFALLLCRNSYCQVWQPLSSESFKEVMTKCNAQNNKENYSLDFTRSVYTHATDAQPVVTSKGKLMRGKGKEYRLESENQLLIQTGDVKMVIDSAEKLILLMKPDTLFDQANLDQLFSKTDFSTSTFFHQKAGSTNRYKVQFAEEGSAYKNLELTLDARTNAILRIEFTLVAGNYVSNDFEDQTEEEPKVVVEYKPMTPLKPNGGYFDVSQWIKRSGGKYELQPQVKYTLDDLRIN